ncbi:uridine kinase [Clostridium beijerinckii]|uniref:Uridine kinase n=1 Tax=Clostridium beijerinckii TaxID=1520 RepID=A0A0B5QR29_CLOBE|nr:kinase [Clostridium beijerinckii]AJG99358.1 uridine kinase [Clostridium beijerinckii]OCA99103.1 uridine kinase [Clostridium beijerinckii]
MAKLIILRGNSGSGKTTTGKALQRKFGQDTMLISQDVVRRDILFAKDGPNPKAGELIFELVLYGKRRCNIVILEGILNSKWYKKLFQDLSDEFNNQIFAYYFDIPFEETLNRHKQKSNSHEFGEKEMREWWNEKDLSDAISEVCLHKELSLNEIVNIIYRDVIK